MRLPSIDQQNVWLTHVGRGDQARMEARNFAGFDRRKAARTELFQLWQFQTAPYMVARIVDRKGREIAKRLMPEERISRA